ncbi:FG-GAP repeat protein [Ruegeria arenilitoris]|uniref:FG-GAP repeat protein n=1 Tax=Ruegeria arenilitoris TaxID=1173585 RepID=UPI00147A4A13|nr:FG-GAP repeat protein [Ruegeria arenilitoris]
MPAQVIDLNSLSSTDGFFIQGDTSIRAFIVDVSSAGDVNGDGFDDIILGTPRSDANGVNAGGAYVVFGAGSGLTDIDLANLSPSQGYKILGIGPDDYAGQSVSSAGDINGDGFDDVILGAPGNFSYTANFSGAYVVYGKASGFSDIDLGTLSASDGFSILGENSALAGPPYGLGAVVADAGDVNGDGIDDFLVNYPASAAGGSYAGETYVLYGKTSGFTDIDVSNLSAADGFTIEGANSVDYSGFRSSSAGDINGDGFDDLIIGGGFSNNFDGGAHVIFGSGTGLPDIDLGNLSAGAGFEISTNQSGIQLGEAVAGIGDVNGDGIDDIALSARSDPSGNLQAGLVYVIYGKTSGFSDIDIDNLSPADGFTITGQFDGVQGDFIGSSMSAAGDMNGDGIDDFLIGTFGGSGNVYVVYGKAGGFSDLDLTNFDDTDGFIIQGNLAGRIVDLIGDINGDGADDIIITGSKSTGEGGAFVVYGKPSGPTTGDDNLTGTNGDDTIKLLGGADVYDGLAGNDDINGGGGNDTINGGADADVISGRNGNDILTGGSGNDIFEYVDTAEGNDRITDFTQGEDVIDVSQANITSLSELSPVTVGLDTVLSFGTTTITLEGFTGTLSDTDFIFLPVGTNGNDSIVGNGKDNVFDGLAGDDQILGKGGNDTISGGADNDDLRGGGGDDLLLGDDGADRLAGGNGNDTLDGGSGSDVLIGQTGNDIMTGGGDADVFVFNKQNDSDTITDFTIGEDVLRLKPLGITDISEVTQTDQGSDLLVSFGTSDVLLLGLAGSTLTMDDFVFA